MIEWLSLIIVNQILFMTNMYAESVCNKFYSILYNYDVQILFLFNSTLNGIIPIKIGVYTRYETQNFVKPR